LVANSSLEETQQRELTELLAQEEYREARAMTTTWYEQGLRQGLRQGLQQGLEEGQRRLVHSQLETRFGPLSEEARKRMASWPVQRLEELGLALVTAGSLRELGLEQ
jgi:flagellar biosynthesis/type III secretory pathway protein FliH